MNEIYLEKARANGVEIRSFEDWKRIGKWVKRGEKQKSVRVKSGHFKRMNPITGEDVYEPQYKFAYGFTKDQVN